MPQEKETQGVYAYIPVILVALLITGCWSFIISLQAIDRREYIGAAAGAIGAALSFGSALNALVRR